MPNGREPPSDSAERQTAEQPLRDLVEHAGPSEVADATAKGGEVLHDTAPNVIRKIGGCDAGVLGRRGDALASSPALVNRTR